jgi:GT2 family glycosyltransferase
MTSVFDRSFWADEGDALRCSTANVLYPRAVLERVDGFDTSFVFWGEDTDLAMRAMAAGEGHRYVDAAITYHAVHRRGVMSTLRERWRSGWVVRLVRQHPQLRTEAFYGNFWSQQHQLLVLALLGVPLLALTPIALLMPTPWIRHGRHRVNYLLGETARSPLRWLRSLVGLLVLDGVELGSCAWHSLRERTLFL